MFYGAINLAGKNVASLILGRINVARPSQSMKLSSRKNVLMK